MLSYSQSVHRLVARHSQRTRPGGPL